MPKQFETYDSFQELFQIVREKEPEFLKLAMPRRYNAPGDYPNYGPVVVPSLYQNALITTLGHGTNNTINTGYTLFCKLAHYQMPTYHVDRNLCDALAATAPPDDLLLDDIKWPMPAMIFMLPVSFSHKFFGRQINYISTCRFEPEEKYPSPGFIQHGLMQPVSVHSRLPQMMIYFESVEPTTRLVSNYNTNSPVNRKVSEAITDDIKYYGNIISPELQTFDPKSDGELANRVFSFVVKLLLVMTARPAFVETGALMRAEKMKHGRLRDALWAPNYIGRSYRVLEDSTAQGGTHASPRLHWRRGHLREQAYGTGLLLRKVLWIEPTIVGANEEEHASKIVPGAATAAK